MSFTLVFTESYNCRAAKWLRKHLDLRLNYQKTLQLLELNPFHPSLRLHALQGRLQGMHSVSINLSYRITIDLLISDQETILLNVGDHNSIYRDQQ